MMPSYSMEKVGPGPERARPSGPVQLSPSTVCVCVCIYIRNYAQTCDPTISVNSKNCQEPSFSYFMGIRLSILCMSTLDHLMSQLLRVSLGRKILSKRNLEDPGTAPSWIVC